LRLASERTVIWIFSDGDVAVGQVRADVDGDVAEVSIVVAPERRGQGYGKAMLSEAMSLLRRDFGSDVRARALVLDDHDASLRTFKACGFRVVGPAARDDGQRATVLELEAGR
jgi:L-amino acid N-acyltransferase YncA